MFHQMDHIFKTDLSLEQALKLTTFMVLDFSLEV
jgi:hypothetical protein